MPRDHVEPDPPPRKAVAVGGDPETVWHLSCAISSLEAAEESCPHPGETFWMRRYRDLLRKMLERVEG